MIYIFSNLWGSTFWKSVMGFLNQQVLAKNWGILQTRMDQSSESENEFWVFSNSEMNFTNRYSRRSRWKKFGVICVVSMFPSWVMILKCYDPLIVEKSEFFAILCWSQQKNLKILKQFTYMHLKALVTHFQKIVLFFMLWLNMFWRY